MELNNHQAQEFFRGLKREDLPDKILFRIKHKDDEHFQLFDEEDNAIIVEGKPVVMYRSDCHSGLQPPGSYHRGVNIFILHKGKLLVPTRADDKDLYPGYLDISVGEHVKVEENYVAAAIRGCKEEIDIDITGDDLEFLFSMDIDMDNNSEHAHYYQLRTSQRIRLSEELQDAEWIDIQELARRVAESTLPFRTDQITALKRYLGIDH